LTIRSADLARVADSCWVLGRFPAVAQLWQFFVRWCNFPTAKSSYPGGGRIGQDKRRPGSLPLGRQPLRWRVARLRALRL